MKTRTQQIEELQKEWTQPRWEGIRRPYSAEEVVKLRVWRAFVDAARG